MAVITTGVLASDYVPYGRHYARTFRVPVVNGAAADEWINTGLSIKWILGVVAIGTAVGANLAAFRKNAQGTGQTEGSTIGALAIEGDASTTYEVTVAGDKL